MMQEDRLTSPKSVGKADVDRSSKGRGNLYRCSLTTSTASGSLWDLPAPGKAATDASALLNQEVSPNELDVTSRSRRLQRYRFVPRARHLQDYTQAKDSHQSSFRVGFVDVDPLRQELAGVPGCAVVPYYLES